MKRLQEMTTAELMVLCHKIASNSASKTEAISARAIVRVNDLVPRMRADYEQHGRENLAERLNAPRAQRAAFLWQAGRKQNFYRSD
jgi:hypothetical protein